MAIASPWLLVTEISPALVTPVMLPTMLAPESCTAPPALKARPGAVRTPPASVILPPASRIMLVADEIGPFIVSMSVATPLPPEPALRITLPFVAETPSAPMVKGAADVVFIAAILISFPAVTAPVVVTEP